MGDREQGERNRRAVTLVLLGGGAGLFAGGAHLATEGPPRIMRVAIMRTAGVMMAVPPPGGWNAVSGIVTSIDPVLEVGETFQLVVASMNAVGNTADVTPLARFTVLDAEVAQVTSAGVVRALAEGRTTLVVSFPDAATGINHSQTLGFSVTRRAAARAPLSSLAIHCAAEALTVGDVVQLAVRDRSGRDVTTRVALATVPPEAATIDADRRLRVLTTRPFKVIATLDDPALTAEATYVADPAPGCGSIPTEPASDASAPGGM